MSAVLDSAPRTWSVIAALKAGRRPFFWCVRRELWENRFVFIAPGAVALLVAAAYLIGAVHLRQNLDVNPQQAGTMPPTGLPFSIGAVAVIVTGFISGVFYSLGALYTERRDRSILFWKSLPISDSTVVLAKVAIPLAVLPAISFLVTLAMQFAMLAMGVLFAGQHLSGLWLDGKFAQMAVVLLYGFAAMALWYAPLYGWLFLVSAWAKRAPFLWAVLPVLGLCVAEKVAFGSSALWSIIMDRLAGAYDAAFNTPGGIPGVISPGQMAPRKFLSMPDLWAGLLVSIGFFAVAIRLRRYQGPL